MKLLFTKTRDPPTSRAQNPQLRATHPFPHHEPPIQHSVYGGSIYLATVGFAWNSDAYETGKRAFTQAELKLAPGVSLFGFYTDTVVAPTIGHNLQGLNAGIEFDAKSLVNKTRRIF